VDLFSKFRDCSFYTCHYDIQIKNHFSYRSTGGKWGGWTNRRADGRIEIWINEKMERNAEVGRTELDIETREVYIYTVLS